jgi:hypothetical protein
MNFHHGNSKAKRNAPAPSNARKNGAMRAARNPGDLRVVWWSVKGEKDSVVNGAPQGLGLTNT